MSLTRRSVVAGAGAMVAFGRHMQSRPRTPWNILLISSDEHNAGVMSCAGHPVVRTPNLDRIARDGVRMDACYAAAPVCAPARQSLVTGLWPPEHGQISNGHVFNPQHPTLVGAWTQNGLTTAGYGKLHTNSEHQGQVGFATWAPGQDTWYVKTLREQMRGPNPPGRKDPADEAIFQRIRDKRFWGMPLVDDHLLPDRAVLDASLDFLAQPHEQPFFLYASFVQPHHFWTLPEEHYYRYDPAQVDLPRRGAQGNPQATLLSERHHWDEDMDEEAHRLCRARYYGGVSYIDSLVGKLLDAVDDLGLRENTLVAYVSDHGDMLGEKGIWFKGVCYEGASRIPVMIRQPGVLPAGQVLDMPLNQLDLLPTLGGLTGHATPECSGQDLSRALLGKAEPSERTFCVEGAYPGSDPAMLMLRRGTEKLIRYGRGKREPRLELYDLASDPWEEVELSAERPERAQELLAELDAWRAEWKEPQFPLEKNARSTSLD